MGMQSNWRVFIETTKSKGEAHMKVARHWDAIHNTFNLLLIFLTSITTVLALLDDAIPFLVLSVISGGTTLVSAISGFLKPSENRQTHLESAKEFRCLMVKMIRCETEPVYEELWRELNKTLLGEPFLPKRFIVETNLDLHYTMTPELNDIVVEKDQNNNNNTLEEKNNQDANRTTPYMVVSTPYMVGSTTIIGGGGKEEKGLGQPVPLDSPQNVTLDDVIIDDVRHGLLDDVRTSTV